MALTWALILLLSYLCELGKLWTQTSYLTSLGLRVLSVKREQWHLVELGWDSPQPASLCWAQEKDCQAEGKRGPAPSGRFPRVLHMPASSLIPLAWPWPGFLTLWPQCIPTAASQQCGIFSMLAMPALSELPPQTPTPQETRSLKAQNPRPMGLLL